MYPQVIQNLESEQFFISFIDWKKIDILISTPSQFNILVKAQTTKNSVSITPKFVVLDEFDQMLTDKKYFKSIQNLLSDLGANARGSKLTEDMLERKVVCPSPVCTFRRKHAKEILWHPCEGVLGRKFYEH